MFKYKVTYLILHTTKLWTEESEVIEYDEGIPADMQALLPFMNLDQYKDFEHGYILCWERVPDTVKPEEVEEALLEVVLDALQCARYTLINDFWADREDIALTAKAIEIIEEMQKNA